MKRDYENVESKENVLAALQRIVELRKEDLNDYKLQVERSSYRNNLQPATKTITEDYTPGIGNYSILADTTAGAIVVTLPPPAQFYCCVFIVKKIAGGNNLTVDGDGVNIDGAGTLALNTLYNYAGFQSDGTQWWRII
jgi:hypothetical protein